MVEALTGMSRGLFHTGVMLILFVSYDFSPLCRLLWKIQRRIIQKKKIVYFQQTTAKCTACLIQYHNIIMTLLGKLYTWVPLTEKQ